MNRIKSLALIVTFWLSIAAAYGQAPQPHPDNYSDVLAYIDKAWGQLTRSMADCDTVMDKRVPEHSIVYLPADYPEPASLKELQTKCKVAVKNLAGEDYPYRQL